MYVSIVSGLMNGKYNVLTLCALYDDFSVHEHRSGVNTEYALNTTSGILPRMHRYAVAV